MASAEKQHERDSENHRIECKSKRSINIMMQTMKEEFLKICNSRNLTVETESNSVCQRVFQTYKTAFLSNVLVDGQVVSDIEDEDEDTTLEFEPFDAEKEHFIQHDLMNRFDEQLINTTRLRKTGPHIVRSHLKKTIRPELKYLALVNVVPESKETELESMEHEMESVKEDIEKRLHDTAQTLDTMKQSSEEMLVKSKDLLQALKLYLKTEKSDTHQVMCETPPPPPVTKPGHHNTNIKCEISKKLLL